MVIEAINRRFGRDIEYPPKTKGEILVPQEDIDFVPRVPSIEAYLEALGQRFPVLAEDHIIPWDIRFTRRDGEDQYESTFYNLRDKTYINVRIRDNRLRCVENTSHIPSVQEGVQKVDTTLLPSQKVVRMIVEDSRVKKYLAFAKSLSHSQKLSLFLNHSAHPVIQPPYEGNPTYLYTWSIQDDAKYLAVSLNAETGVFIDGRVGGFQDWPDSSTDIVWTSRVNEKRFIY